MNGWVKTAGLPLFFMPYPSKYVNFEKKFKIYSISIPLFLMVLFEK
jgi:hypothetical protein